VTESKSSPNTRINSKKTSIGLDMLRKMMAIGFLKEDLCQPEMACSEAKLKDLKDLMNILKIKCT